MKRKKKSHIFQNRKAFFTNPIVDFFVYLVFIMVVIFFVTIFRVSSGTIERTIKSDFQDLDLEKINASISKGTNNYRFQEYANIRSFLFILYFR